MTDRTTAEMVASVMDEPIEDAIIRLDREARAHERRCRMLYKLHIADRVSGLPITEADLRKEIIYLSEYIKGKDHINKHGGFKNGKPNTWYDCVEIQQKRDYVGYLNRV